MKTQNFAIGIRYPVKMIVLLVGLILTGLTGTACKDNPVQDYGNKVLEAYDRSGKVAGGASLANLQRALDAYRAANGNYPPSLQELEAFTGEPVDPNLFRYDPQTGKLELAP